MSSPCPPSIEFETAILALGSRMVAEIPSSRSTLAASADRFVMRGLSDDAALRAALFRFVDVRPACHGPADLVRHLHEFLLEAGDSGAASRLARLTGVRPLRRPAALAASLGVRRVARRFIIGETVQEAGPELADMWARGTASTVDLLGEATVTQAEADRYAERCTQALRALASGAAAWPRSELLEQDPRGALPRVNLSIKVSALTPELRSVAPERGVAGAEGRLRGLLRVARDVGAHLHIDMESVDTQDTITAVTLKLLSEPEFERGPSAGIVLQAYLKDSARQLDLLLEWASRHTRRPPLTIRLVKGAYWDHEVVEATQHGWPVPVFTDRADCDRQFEWLTRRLIDHHALVRTAVASHNLRSVAHAATYAAARGLSTHEIEFQVLRGLGDDLAHSLVANGFRVRVYCPVGDLTSGMAYLVRRLLENTANNSFLAAQHAGATPEQLLQQP